MSTFTNKISELFDDPNPMQEEVKDYVDLSLFSKKTKEEILNTFSEVCEGEEYWYGVAYLEYKWMRECGNMADETCRKLDKKAIPILLKLLDNYEGWHNFKIMMRTMVANCQMEERRRKAGLQVVHHKLHTVVAGRSGTGKSTCISFMLQLYVQLGLLEEGKKEIVSVADLVRSDGYGTVMEHVSKAQNGMLVIRNAQDLYKTDIKVFDEIPHVIRALTDALENKKAYPQWMLVLEGDPDGLEMLLSANPGLKKHFSYTIHLEDFTVDELCRLFEEQINAFNFTLTKQARKQLEIYFSYQYQHRGPNYDNIHMLRRVLEQEVIPAANQRLQTVKRPSTKQLLTIEAEDIPAVYDHSEEELRLLNDLVGLETIKGKVNDYLNVVRLSKMRMEMGLSTTMPRLHMVFLGNPGTGKTTVAKIIGKVFASWGILSNGCVICTEKSKMVGEYIGETERKMNQLLAQARGNVLFIDEAYQLVEGGEMDFGRIVMDSLLTELGKDELDMVVIMAGYTAPMKKLIESNEGIESRFPNVFNFEDYSVDDLVKIAKVMAQKQGLVFAKGVEGKICSIIQEEHNKPSSRFGNARFVSNLLQNEILSTMGKRIALMANPTKKDLCLIQPEDVVIGKKRKDVVFDDLAVNAALARLDCLAGLDNVKKAIHDFVQSARYLQSRGEDYLGNGLLSWRFIGKSGTGKSTVAEIMAVILKGMRLIATSHIVEIKGERILNVSDYDCDLVLRDAVKRSCNGLVFIDVDASGCGESPTNYYRRIEYVLMRLKELTIEMGGECALIVAELIDSVPNGDLAERLSDAGIYNYDHILVFKDYTPDELFQVLDSCLRKKSVSFTPQAESHMRKYIKKLSTSEHANARTMEIMSRTIYQRVVLRESELANSPKMHQVELEDVDTFLWDSRKGRIGY